MGEATHEYKPNEKAEDSEDGEAEDDELSKKSWYGEEEEGAEYPEQASQHFMESDGEKSLDLPDSPRPLSQEARNLTASELLLNKSVELIKKTPTDFMSIIIYIYIYNKK